MVFFNYATMQMAAKIVYYGPGLCGKTTNLQHVYSKTSPQSRGEMVSLETETDRTLFFDLLPIDVGVIGGFKTRLQLYTVPGQVFYNTTRKLVLKGADGIVFVADSQEPMLDANVQSMKNLRANLEELSLSLDDIPLVIQLNKRDLPNVLSKETLETHLNPQRRWPTVESSAVKGEGVFETLKLISKLTLKKLRSRMTGEEESPAPRSTFHVHSGPSTSNTAERESASFTIDDEIDSNRTVSAPNPLAVPSTAPAQPGSDTATAVEEYGEDREAQEQSEIAASQPEADLADADVAEDVPEDTSPGDESYVPAHFPYPGDAQPDEQNAPEEDSSLEGPPAEIEEDTPPPAKPDRGESPQEAPAEASAVKRVKVRSTVDIMAELEVLRKNATGKTGGETAVDSSRRDLHKSLHIHLDPSHREDLRSVQLTVEMKDGGGNNLTTETKSWELTAEEFRKLIVSLNIDLP